LRFQDNPVLFNYKQAKSGTTFAVGAKFKEKLDFFARRLHLEA
jgi:hypothetical protein